MNRNEFDRRPFVAGSLVGIRAFDVNARGALSAVTRDHVFEAGENVGHCCLGVLGQLMQRMTMSMSVAAHPKDDVAAEHQVGGRLCSCGYYAYFWGRNQYAEAGTVTGLIEGYGVCTVGDRGFRAEKARLVALVDPAGRSWWPRQWTAFHVWANGLIGGRWRTWTAGLVVSLVAGHFLDLATPQTLPLLGVQAFGWALMFAAFRKTPPRPPVPIEVVADNYPGVQVYPTLRAALVAHPTTPPAGSTRPTVVRRARRLASDVVTRVKAWFSLIVEDFQNAVEWVGDKVAQR